MGEEGEDVLLYVYDLSNGLAAAMSPQLLGKQVGPPGCTPRSTEEWCGLGRNNTLTYSSADVFDVKMERGC